MLAPAQTIDYEGLIRPDRIHGSLYYDPAIFQQELERIWYREWIFVGHDSEVPQPGDWRTGHLGQQPIILARGSDGEVRVFLNRCRHRANTVCEQRRGNSMTLMCPYHGWTFSIDGNLQGVPFKEGYGPDFNLADYGLLQVARLASYRGFLFASMAPDGPTLAQSLGAPVLANIDRFCDISPTGRIRMDAGVYRMRLHANWKMWTENSVDAYHVPTTHASNFYMGSMTENERLKQQAGRKGAFGVISSRDLGNGHSELDMRPQRRITGMTYTGEWAEEIPSQAQQRYHDAMVTHHGKEKAERLLVDGPPHTVVFPNLFFMLQEIRWCVPVSVDETWLYYAPCLLEGAPDEVNTARLRRDEGAYGPAGFQLSDDIEVWERNYRGLRARADEWILMARGLHEPPQPDEDGLPAQGGMSDITLQAQWGHYKQLMIGAA